MYIYIVIYFSFSAIFPLPLITKTRLKKRTCFLHSFKNISSYIWMITWTKKAKYFQMAKFHPQGVA